MEAGNLREELLHQVHIAEGHLETAIQQLRASAPPGSVEEIEQRAQAQTQGLARLRDRIAGSRTSDLASIRNEVAASIAVSQTLLPTAPAAATNAKAVENALHAAAHATRHTVSEFVHDFYERKVFDPYLRFASAEDEEAHRKREQERREAIEKALAQGTPQGDLLAANLMVEQLKDAGAHGADQSPDYAPMLERASRSRDDLKHELERAEVLAPHASVVPTSSLAALRAAGVSLADQSQEGHGIIVSNQAGPRSRL